MRLDIAWVLGRYGGYVLASYASSLIALLWMAIHAHRRWRSALRLARHRAQVGTTYPGAV